MENDIRKTIKVPESTHGKIKLAAVLASENISQLLDRLAGAEIEARSAKPAKKRGKSNGKTN